ncbi:MAG: hypothetical protein JW814_08530 [Candidatus Krumholzibacteriota bacterium]|nr:hypothetical protein [Candidatus Krumholzibacteriota bacterium]
MNKERAFSIDKDIPSPAIETAISQLLGNENLDPPWPGILQTGMRGAYYIASSQIEHDFRRKITKHDFNDTESTFDVYEVHKRFVTILWREIDLFMWSAIQNFDRGGNSLFVLWTLIRCLQGTLWITAILQGRFIFPEDPDAWIASLSSEFKEPIELWKRGFSAQSITTYIYFGLKACSVLRDRIMEYYSIELPNNLSGDALKLWPAINRVPNNLNIAKHWRTIIDPVIRACQKQRDFAAALVYGSAGRGFADRFTKDIDIVCMFHDDVLTEEQQNIFINNLGGGRLLNDGFINVKLKGVDVVMLQSVVELSEIFFGSKLGIETIFIPNRLHFPPPNETYGCSVASDPEGILSRRIQRMKDAETQMEMTTWARNEPQIDSLLPIVVISREKGKQFEYLLHVIELDRYLLELLSSRNGAYHRSDFLKWSDYYINNYALKPESCLETLKTSLFKLSDTRESFSEFVTLVSNIHALGRQGR